MKEAGDMGVSWHYVEADFTANLYSGTIVAQQNIFLDGGGEIDSLLALKGADLMIYFLTGLSNNKIVSTK